MANFVASTDEMSRVARDLMEWNREYVTCANNIIGIVDGLPKDWGGTAQETYRNQLHGFQDDFQALCDLFERYSEYLFKTAQRYEDVENNITNAAKCLSTGK